VPLHPVVEVMVAPGEHVKKGQILVKLDQAQAHAAIDGVVSGLDVDPGLVSRPGTSLWGEIVDLRELDVKCELTPRQAEDDVALGQPVELRLADAERPLPLGPLVFIGSVADRKTGRVPVLVRLHNSDQRLRCGVPVSVRFPVGPAAYAYRN
jgi:multidrug efflux pump subunit AcrA (membrane-fusion protein)